MKRESSKGVKIVSLRVHLDALDGVTAHIRVGKEHFHIELNPFPVRHFGHMSVYRAYSNGRRKPASNDTVAFLDVDENENILEKLKTLPSLFKSSEEAV